MRLHWVLTGAAALAGTVLAAGCGSTPGNTAAGSGPSKSAAASPATGPASTSPSTSPLASNQAAYPMPSGPPVTTTATCGPAAPAGPAHSVAALQFVSAADGFADGPSAILATTDGGATWRAQLTGQLKLTGLDFVTARDGWAVGTGTFLATTDGGAHWTPLADPCLRSIHFVSATTGYAVAGGSGLDQFGAPEAAGELLGTADGGRTWHQIAAPPAAQSVCFDPGGHGWLGAGGRIYQSGDGGAHWHAVTAPLSGTAGQPAVTIQVQCAGHGTGWAELIGPGAASSQEPHIGYYLKPGAAVPLFAEQYFPHPGISVSARAPGSYAAAMSAISPTAAEFVDWCPACGTSGSAQWGLVTGVTITARGTVPGLTQPEAASFLSPQVGWVAGTDGTAGRILATSNGGRSWQVQYRG